MRILPRTTKRVSRNEATIEFCRRYAIFTFFFIIRNKTRNNNFKLKDEADADNNYTQQGREGTARYRLSDKRYGRIMMTGDKGTRKQGMKKHTQT